MPTKKTRKSTPSVRHTAPSAPPHPVADSEKDNRPIALAHADADEKAQLLRTLSEQIAELREMNVDILSRAAFIQAALDTLLTIHAGVDAGTRDLYASYFFSSRETIAAGMRHLGMQQALEDFLNRTRLVSEEDQAAAA